LKIKVLLAGLSTLGLAILLASTVAPLLVVHSASDDVWRIVDVIEPTLDKVKWSEEGVQSMPASWIADGTWDLASMRQSLVSQSDIFVSLYESFHWSMVRSSAEEYYDMQFNSISAFATVVQANANPWLTLAWQMDTQWYGISQNTTKVSVSFTEASDTVYLSIWFHITRVPEYLSGDKLTNWLTGFDLTPISVGNMQLWELYEDWSDSGTAYRLQFEAPASVLEQHGENYTCTLAVDASVVGNAYKVDQVIDIEMPAQTVVKEFSPSSLSVSEGNNVGSFVLVHGNYYPTDFIVTSSPPEKNALMDVVAAWSTTPAGWAAIASLLVLSFTALRGRRIYGRSRMYHRLYHSMVTLYDLYNRDYNRFNTEMENTSKTVFKMMVDDKISDEQFEKLLKRRDDLLERAIKQLPAPPKL
jgi:hypothetical protein